MAIPSERRPSRTRREHMGDTASTMLRLVVGLVLLVSTRTTPGSGSHPKTIGVAIALLIWGCLSLAQMRALLRTRVASPNSIERIARVSQGLACLALVAGATGILRAVLGPVPMPGETFFWLLILLAFVSIYLDEFIYSMVLLTVPRLPSLERTDPERRERTIT